MPHWPRYGRIEGPIVMIGFGSIGKGTLPLIERHFDFDQDRFIVVDPNDADRKLLDERGVKFAHLGLTRDNYRDVLGKHLKAGEGQSFCVNLSVDTSSLDIMRFCREIGALYIDTVVEPWPGFYYDKSRGNESRTNYALRETVMEERRKNPGGTTAISCCGANPGMVSWFVKQALINLSADLGAEGRRTEVARGLGEARGENRRQGRAYRRARHAAGQASEAAQCLRQHLVDRGFSVGGHAAGRARLGHAREMGAGQRRLPQAGCGAAIYLNQPGANTRVRSWTPTARGQFGFLVTHNELISIADYYTVRDGKGEAVYRPTCHYAYHPCDDAVLSLHELFGRAGEIQSAHHILGEAEIVDGIDELGVLLYGHARNAYWYGSQLSVEETRALAPYQNATGMQVTSAVLAGMVWALENPKAGIVEADEMDFRRCLEMQTPYLGPVVGVYTDWTRSPIARGSSPRTSTRATPGSSATCW